MYKYLLFQIISNRIFMKHNTTANKTYRHLKRKMPHQMRTL